MVFLEFYMIFRDFVFIFFTVHLVSVLVGFPPYTKQISEPLVDLQDFKINTYRKEPLNTTNCA